MSSHACFLDKALHPCWVYRCPCIMRKLPFSENTGTRVKKTQLALLQHWWHYSTQSHLPIKIHSWVEYKVWKRIKACCAYSRGTEYNFLSCFRFKRTNWTSTCERYIALFAVEVSFHIRNISVLWMTYYTYIFWFSWFIFSTLFS